MTRRVIIGRRGDEAGIWISKPGIDAEVAEGSELLLALSERSEQIIMMGVASPLPQTIPLGLSQRPFVILTSTSVIPVEFNGSQAQSSQGGLVRPYPYGSSTGSNCEALVTTTELTISGGSASCHYIVMRRALP